MSILKVARLGHPVLRKPAAAVSSREIQSSNTRQLIDDMIETMKEYDGVGLAADQVHVSKQIAVLEVADNGRALSAGALAVRFREAEEMAVHPSRRRCLGRARHDHRRSGPS